MRTDEMLKVEEVVGELRADNERLRAALKIMFDACDKGSHDSYEIYRACEKARALVQEA